MRCAIAPLCLALTSCSNYATTSDMVAETGRRDEQTHALEVRISALEAQQDEFKQWRAREAGYTADLMGAHESLRKVVNANARLHDDEAIKDMTKRGACGVIAINYPNGGVVYQNRICTAKDLSPPPQ